MPFTPPTPAEAQLSDSPAAAPRGRLAPWEALACDAVGNVIEFWGFKRNQGRVWALLYLRSRPHTAAELQAALGVSKGGVSMLVRELEHWRVVQRVRRPGERAWRFEANTDLLAMVGAVLESREARFLSQVEADLAQAERLARQDPSAPLGIADRLSSMRSLASRVADAVGAFARTARLDVRGIVHVLERRVRRHLPLGQ